MAEPAAAHAALLTYLHASLTFDAVANQWNISGRLGDVALAAVGKDIPSAISAFAALAQEHANA